MSTASQEVQHAIRHFFCCFLVIKYVNLWFPIKDFFRSLWWRAWGHNPKKEPEFHLGQMSFDDNYFRMMKLSNAIMSIVEIIHGNGEDDCYRSNAFMYWSRYRNFKYQKYSIWEPIVEICQHPRPGLHIIDWICKTDGIHSGRFMYRVKLNPQFQEIVDKVLTLEFKPTTVAVNGHEGG